MTHCDTSRKRWASSLAKLLTAAALLASTSAVAQDPSQDSLPLERFRTPVDTYGFGTAEGAMIPDHLDFQVGTVGNYALNPLYLEDRDGTRTPIIGNRVASDLLFSIGLFDYFSLGVDLPLLLFQNAGSSGVPTIDEALGLANGVSSIGIGDVRLVPKFRLLREDVHYVSVTLIPAFTAPTASGLNFTNGFAFDYGGSYLGEGPLAFSFRPELAVSTNIFGFRFAGNLAWRLRQQKTYLGVIPVGPDITYRLGVGYDFHDLLDEHIPVIGLPSLLLYAELFGATSDRNPFGLIPDANATPAQQAIRDQESRLATALEWSAGVRWGIAYGIHVEAGVGSGILNGYGTPDLRIYGGVRYAFTRPDKDGDGILDGDDACVDEPEDEDGFQDADGCPDTDNDEDGLPDAADACPNEAEDTDGFDDQDGCPELDNDEDGTPDAKDDCPDEIGPADNRGCPIPDRDGDGVADVDDACPDEPGEANLDGCPLKDSDEDGVPDHKDLCPNMKGLVDRDGCPPPDKDKDGVLDDVDKCPEQPGPVEREGCPLNDRDLDGVLDKDDKCPDEKGPATRQGCPIPDADGDGIEDKIDKCPTQAGPAMLEGCPDKDGDGIADAVDKCPDSPGLKMFEGCGDSDKDGIPDNVDKCPDEPEVINGVKDEDGCPDKGKVLVVITKEKIEIKEKVFFRTGRATIQRQSFSLLNQVSQVLQANPEIKKVRVEGHTDSQGRASSNKRLSQQRAEAVMKYLVGRGVEEERLVAEGFGEERPIADNNTKDGRAENRRVEFVIVEQ